MWSVIVPWKPDGAHRSASWQILKGRHEAAGRTVVEGICEGEWCKAEAVADALTKTDADMLVIHDADVWVDGIDELLADLPDAEWWIPHRLVHRLAEDHRPGGSLAQKPYVGWAGGGVTIISRSVYERCPLDPRFTGWGQEDESWALALTALYGLPWRGDADLWHWWHPPQPRLSRGTGSREGQALARRYKRAGSDRRQMLALIEEGRTWQASTSVPIVPASRPS